MQEKIGIGTERINDLSYADDVDLLDESLQDVDLLAKNLQDVAERVGLKINKDKVYEADKEK